MKLAGKSVLVTGGATGIGLALAAQLVRSGCAVMICGRREERVAAALARVPGLRGMACDLARNEEIARLADRVASELGDLDVLINNAGVQVQTDVASRGCDPDLLDREILTNLGAPMKLVQAFAPVLLRRPEAAIVNITSLLALMPKPNAPGYCASKAGLCAYSDALRIGLAGTAVEVFLVFPPLVATPMTEGRGSGKMAPEAFAAEMLRQIEAGRHEIRVGQAATILRLHRLCPPLAAWWTRRISK